jgi:hypothetical protein
VSILHARHSWSLDCTSHHLSALSPRSHRVQLLGPKLSLLPSAKPRRPCNFPPDASSLNANKHSSTGRVRRRQFSLVQRRELGARGRRSCCKRSLDERPAGHHHSVGRPTEAVLEPFESKLNDWSTGVTPLSNASSRRPSWQFLDAVEHQKRRGSFRMYWIS